MIKISKDCPGYPLIYATDWVCDALGLAVPEAIEWIELEAENSGVSVRQLAEEIANRYVLYWQKHIEADKIKAESMEYLKYCDKCSGARDRVLTRADQ